MTTIRMLISCLIIVAGPMVTSFLLLSGKGDGTGISPVIIVSVLIATAITAASSTAAHLLLKQPLLATTISILVSEILYVVFVVAYTYCMSDGLQRSESIMWLPIIILFIIPFGFPTAFSVSYGTGRILRDLMDVGQDESKRSKEVFEKPDLVQPCRMARDKSNY